jgi:hypothetical protein
MTVRLSTLTQTNPSVPKTQRVELTSLSAFLLTKTLLNTRQPNHQNPAISTKDSKSTIDRFIISNVIKKNNIAKTHMTDLTKSIRSENSFLSNFLDKEYTKNQTNDLDESISTKAAEITIDYDSLWEILEMEKECVNYVDNDTRFEYDWI